MIYERLWREYRATKNPAVRQELVLSHLWLVKRLAGRVAVRYPSLLSREDLEGYGVLGLMDAVDKYDLDKGVEFEAYASTRIRGAMLDEIRKQNWIPRSTWVKLRQYFSVKERLEKKQGGDAPEERLASEMGITVDELRKLTGNLNRQAFVSLEGTYTGNNGEAVNYAHYLEDYNSPDPLEIVEKAEGHANLAQAINQLADKDQLVLALYYQEELTLKEIGKIMDISESRVCQLHARAIKRLKSILEEMSDERNDQSTGGPGGKIGSGGRSGCFGSSGWPDRLRPR